MKFKMEWEGTFECDGHVEIRGGIRVIVADNEKEAVKRAFKFFQYGHFVNWNAILEDGVNIYIIDSE